MLLLGFIYIYFLTVYIVNVVSKHVYIILIEKKQKQKQSLRCIFNDVINDLKVEITKGMKNELSKQHEILLSQNKILQQQVPELHKLNIQAINEELEQHETCLCLCIEGIPLKNMKQESVLDSVKNYFELAEFNIFDGVVDRVHRIGRACKDDASN